MAPGQCKISPSYVAILMTKMKLGTRIACSIPSSAVATLLTMVKLGTTTLPPSLMATVLTTVKLGTRTMSNISQLRESCFIKVVLGIWMIHPTPPNLQIHVPLQSDADTTPSQSVKAYPYIIPQRRLETSK